MVATDNLREKALRAADRLPVVGEVLQRALRIFGQRDDVSVSQLAANVEQDAVIAGTIVSIANSALYGRYTVVASVRQAVARIGINKTRNVLLGLSVSNSVGRLKVRSPWSLKRFNAHALASATLSDLLVRKVSSTDPEWAFMAGLLHDIGLLVIAVGLPEQFDELHAPTTGDVGLIERELAVLGFTHFDLGAEVVERWKCPLPVQEATKTCQLATFPLQQPLALAAVVKSATLIADSHGLSNFDTPKDAGVTNALLEALEIPQPTEFMQEFYSDYNEMTSPV
ncbi:MAG TPA: HDOD domain-containing protein [Bryobacteraceae bacterium]|jgi:HD-like signal output (HDOD) protein